MRWWNYTNAQGKEEYKYETYSSNYIPNSVDSSFFWST